MVSNVDLKLNKIHLKSFLSIGDAEIDLSDLGISIVKGINKFEPKFESNGSGKSSIFDGIMWAFTGYTTRDVKSVSNEFIPDCPACVELDFSVNSVDYSIIRSENPKSLRILKDNVDISGNTYTKSQDILKLELGSLTYDYLSSIVILSQGLPGRFSNLKPKDRKARLEDLAGFDSDLLKLIDKNSAVMFGLQSRQLELKNEISVLNGRISQNQISIDFAQKQISEIESKVSISEASYLIVKAEYLKRVDETKKVEDRLRGYRIQESPLQRDSSELEYQLQGLKSRIDELKKNLLSFEAGRCPLCGQILQEDSDSHKEKISSELSMLLKKVEDLELRRKELDLTLLNLNSQIEYDNSRLISLNEGQADRKFQIDEYDTSKITTSTYKESVERCQKQIEECKNQQELLKSELLEVDHEYELAAYFKNNLNKKFRTYLLDEVVGFLNQILCSLSGFLYETQGAVHLGCEGNDLRIYLGDREFGALSGGESRRVDLILQLALRKLCEVQSGFHCNVLVLDEILDYLDYAGVQSVLSLIGSNTADVESLLLVTHRPDLDFEFDTEIVVTKGSDQISYVRIEN